MAPGALLRQSGPTALLILCALADNAAAGVLPPQQRIQQSQKVRQAPKALRLTQMHVDAIVTPAPSLEHPQLLPAPALIPPPASTTVPYRLLSVVPWPQPTESTAPFGGAAAATGTAMHELLRRDYNTVCGYISGDPDLPATCSSGSHCVLDTEHSVVGCCPDDSASCTAGVYTGCADGDSTQTEVNPYVYTCAAGSVCYKNEFSGGYYQYGCGSASDMGGTVAMSATGVTSQLDLSSIQVSFTETFESSESSESSTSSTSSESSVLSSVPPSSSTSTSEYSSTSSSSSDSSTSSSCTSTSPAASSTSASSDVPSRKSRDRAGVIIGATISSVAGLIAISALVIFFCWRRRKGNRRNGSGPRGGGPGYLSPASGNFQALHGTAEDFETGLQPEMIQAAPATPGRSSHYSRWPMPDDILENEAWVTPAIGPAAAAAIASGIGGRRATTPDSREPPRKDYRGVTTAVAGVPPRPRTPAVPPLMAGRSTPPPAAVYFQMSPYGGGTHEPDEEVPLTYTDLARGGHLAALSRIGEEEDDEDDSTGEGAGGGGVDDDDTNSQKRGSRLSKASRLSFGDCPEEIQLGSTSRGLFQGLAGTNSTGSGVGAISTAGNSSVDMDGELLKGDSGLEEMPPGSPIRVDAERPLWQQNRQRNRSLMWQ